MIDRAPTRVRHLSGLLRRRHQEPTSRLQQVECRTRGRRVRAFSMVGGISDVDRAIALRGCVCRAVSSGPATRPHCRFGRLLGRRPAGRDASRTASQSSNSTTMMPSSLTSISRPGVRRSSGSRYRRPWMTWDSVAGQVQPAAVRQDLWCCHGCSIERDVRTLHQHLAALSCGHVPRPLSMLQLIGRHSAARSGEGYSGSKAERKPSHLLIVRAAGQGIRFGVGGKLNRPTVGRRVTSAVVRTTVRGPGVDEIVDAAREFPHDEEDVRNCLNLASVETDVALILTDVRV